MIFRARERPLWLLTTSSSIPVVEARVTTDALRAGRARGTMLNLPESLRRDPAAGAEGRSRMRPRKVILGIVGICLPVVAVLTPIGANAAFAGPVGTGTPTCTAASGSIKYSPAWSDADSNTVITAKIKFKFSNCTGGSPTPSFFKASGKLKFTPSASDNECTNEEEAGGTGSLKFKYPGGLDPSTLTGPIWVSNPTEPFVFMESGGDSIAGSYAEGNGFVDISLEETSAVGNCTTGVKSVVLSGGEAYKF
jgi:hypothetical protein